MGRPKLPDTKKRGRSITVNVNMEEYGEILASSQRAGLSLSEYARKVCLGSRVESREDQQARRELLKVNADLGRLGGLLKQALSQGQSRERIHGLLHTIDQMQAMLKERILKL